jgi:hypothetical protein
LWADPIGVNTIDLAGVPPGQHKVRVDLVNANHQVFPRCVMFSWFETRKKEIANRPLIREQAFGEALDPDKLQQPWPLRGPSRPQVRTDAGRSASASTPPSGASLHADDVNRSR